MSKFYALTYLSNSVLVNKSGKKIVHRFAAPDAKPIVVSNHVRTFIWFNPVANVWSIHEVSTGWQLGMGRTHEDAKMLMAKVLKKLGEEKFFQRLTELGPVDKHPEISTNDAFDLMRGYVQKALKSQMDKSFITN